MGATFLIGNIMYAPGEFLFYLLKGEIMRRTRWPDWISIRYSADRQMILRLDSGDFSSRRWEPTHFDLLASDWEIA